MVNSADSAHFIVLEILFTILGARKLFHWCPTDLLSGQYHETLWMKLRSYGTKPQNSFFHPRNLHLTSANIDSQGPDDRPAHVFQRKRATPIYIYININIFSYQPGESSGSYYDQSKPVVIHPIILNSVGIRRIFSIWRHLPLLVKFDRDHLWLS